MDYYKHYMLLCQTRKLMNRFKGDGTYYERHHIIPKWMGGSDKKSNLVLLTAREHYIAHYLLFKHYKDKKSSAAFHRMNNNINNTYIDSKKYSELREHLSLLYSGDNNPSKSLEVRNKISQKVKGELNGMYGKIGHLHPLYGIKQSYDVVRQRQLNLSKIVQVYENDILIKEFQCVRDAANYYGCTTKNILFRIKKGTAKNGIFFNLKLIYKNE